MVRKENKCTKSEWFPENDPPTYNPGARAFQRAIIQSENGRIIPGFAFGETDEECAANSWMLSASKDLFKAVQAFLLNDPSAPEKANYALRKAMDDL
jgi:hypothetical protein